MLLQVEPLEVWPGTLRTSRPDSPFTASLSNTEDLLDRELHAIGARGATVMQLAVASGDLRLDGRMRADARPSHPGVVLSVTDSRRGALRFACDRYRTWQDNLRAIALGMEALRKVDRYGITADDEQYAGFRAIPRAADDGMPSTPSEAAALLASLSDEPAWQITTSSVCARAAYRKALKKVHPDLADDDGSGAFERVQHAWALLNV